MAMLIIYVLVGIVTIAAGVKLHKMFRLFTLPQSWQFKELPIDELPSVSLCIPARNETHAMTECLERALSSTYPKLEIIVLDDGSRDDTSMLIKSFAHAGVRFVEGKPLPQDWLGKNYALHNLAREASGTFLLFADVDTRFKPQSISRIVDYTLREKVDMTSILPLRADGHRLSVLFATLRQFWSIVFHASTHPAVASNAWLVRRSVVIEKMNSLEEVRLAIRPEVLVAKHLSSTKSYRFLISSVLLGVSYEKKWSSQVETSLRLAFPLLGCSLLWSMLVAVGLACMVVPFAGMLTALLDQDMGLFGVSTLLVVAELVVYGYYLSHIWQRGWTAGLFLLPIILLQEASLVVISAYLYVRGRVTWKGRAIRNVTAR